MRLKDLFVHQKKQRPGNISLIVIMGLVLVSFINFSSKNGLAVNTSTGSFGNPLPSGTITMGFGKTKHPITHKPYDHRGIDIAAQQGTPILAPAGGIVIQVNDNEKMGNYLVMQHEDNFQTVYTHLKDSTAEVNDQIRQGETIGHVGNTGLSTGPHLHFELHKEGEPVNPEDYITF